MMAAHDDDNLFVRKRDYLNLQTKYKNVEEANNFFKTQLQDLNHRLKLEEKDKERLKDELHKARTEICKKPVHHHHHVNDNVVYLADLEEVNSRLKGAYQRLEEEFEMRDQTNKELEYTKNMLLAEEKTRILLENRNTVLEHDLKNIHESDLHSQLEETMKRLGEEVVAKAKLKEAKEALEAELEDLTRSLFEEANTMVSKEAREKFELQLTKKRLEQELELAKSKIVMDEKLLSTMKNKFTVLEMKAKKKLHRRTTSSTTAPTFTSPIHANILTASQLRNASSHPNLIALASEAINTRPRSISSSRLTSHGDMHQSVSLPSSPVTHYGHMSMTPLTSPVQTHVLNSIASHHFSDVQLILSPPPPLAFTKSSSDPELNADASTVQITNLDLNSKSESEVPDTVTNFLKRSIPIPIKNPSLTTLPHLPTSPIPQHEIPPTATQHSDDFDEMTQHDTGSVVEVGEGEGEGEGEELDMDWLMDDEEERKEDDAVLYTELEGHIDLQAGLSQFVQFLATAKQDWAGRYMDRVMREDVAPCLRFRAQEDRAYRKLVDSVWNNKVFLEPLAHPVREVCSGCSAENECRWRIRTGSEETKTLGDLCRERVVRTCDFYVFLRNLRQGLIKKTLPNIYKEFIRLRLMMNFARLCAG